MFFLFIYFLKLYYIDSKGLFQVCFFVHMCVLLSHPGGQCSVKGLNHV